MQPSEYDLKKLWRDMYNMKSIQEKVGIYQSQTIDKEFMKTLSKLMDGEVKTDYEIAEENMNKELHKKGLPDLSKILETLQKTNPELFL